MTRLRRTLPPLLLAASVALGGCGGGSAGPTVDPSAPPTPEVPPAAAAGATWLEDQLSDGLVVNDQYDVADVGLSIDVALALAAVDPVAAEDVAAAVTDPRTLASYVGDPDEAAYAGATAKTAVLLRAVDLDPTDAAGTDLLAQLEDLVATTGRTAGRVVDSGPQDFANVVGQSYALRALDGAAGAEGRAVADRVADFLLAQQCEGGGFRSTFSAARERDQACGPEDAPDTDTTALAVVALLGRADSDAGATAAADEALSWLLAEQGDDGSFAGGVVGARADPVPNANSTGLAGQALALAGEDEAAREAAGWIEGLQVDDDAPRPLVADVGAVAYDRAALASGAEQGIAVPQQDQWRRTTAQAVLALAAAPGA